LTIRDNPLVPARYCMTVGFSCIGLSFFLVGVVGVVFCGFVGFAVVLSFVFLVGWWGCVVCVILCLWLVLGGWGWFFFWCWFVFWLVSGGGVGCGVVCGICFFVFLCFIWWVGGCLWAFSSPPLFLRHGLFPYLSSPLLFRHLFPLFVLSPTRLIHGDHC